MTEEEKNKGIEVQEDEVIKPSRARLMKEDHIEHGFTEGCRGCKSIINKQRPQAHSEGCRTRLEAILESSVVEKERKRKANNRGNEWIARKMQRQEVEPMQLDQPAVEVKDPIR
jgi:hypothetical protein